MIFQQFILLNQVGKFRFEHRYRLEQRFLYSLGEKDTQHRARYRLQVTLPPEEGYGQHDPELVRAIPIDMFEEPEKLEAGLQFDLEDETGVYLFTIQEVRDDEVVADGNHELAGMNLTSVAETCDFLVTIYNTRPFWWCHQHQRATRRTLGVGGLVDANAPPAG